ncbi:MAG TPA: hydantoinase B/oxoprolinase family protein [Eoetvoesiella sp.]
MQGSAWLDYCFRIANLSGTRDDGKPFATVLFFNGGMGATAGKDGVSAMSWPSNISSTPIEVAEREAPVFFRNKKLRPDSSGRGEFHGGLGQDICFVSTHKKPLSVVFLTERLKVAAPGLGGGGDGGLGAVLTLIRLPGVKRSIAEELVRNTERFCPYIKMARQGITNIVALVPMDEAGNRLPVREDDAVG